jgi:hypothetical protein
MESRTKIGIFYRPAEVIEGDWQLVGEARSLNDARDELTSWRGPRLGHGDLVVVGAKVPTLYVFDAARGALVQVKKRGDVPWVDFWEGDNTPPQLMLRECTKVDGKRLVLVACACAEIAMQYVPEANKKPRAAIEKARAWVRNEASINEVRSAADATYTSGRGRLSASVYAVSAAYHSAKTAISAYNVTQNRTSPNNAYQFAIDAASDVETATRYASGRSPSGNYPVSREMVRIVRRCIPLSVLACSLVGARDPLPLPRENPPRRRR